MQYLKQKYAEAVVGNSGHYSNSMVVYGTTQFFLNNDMITPKTSFTIFFVISFPSWMNFSFMYKTVMVGSNIKIKRIHFVWAKTELKLFFSLYAWHSLKISGKLVKYVFYVLIVKPQKLFLPSNYFAVSISKISAVSGVL